MKTKHKSFYESPASEVVEMKMQGVLCDSVPSQSAILLLTDVSMNVTYSETPWYE